MCSENSWKQEPMHMTHAGVISKISGGKSL